MEIHIKIIGCQLVILAALHFLFPTYFKWKKELSTLSLVSRQIMYIHSFFIALMVFLMGLLCITSANELISTSLGKKISLGAALFWTARLLMQFIGYSPKIWKGKTFETAVHILLSVFWAYLSVMFILAYFS